MKNICIIAVILLILAGCQQSEENTDKLIISEQKENLADSKYIYTPTLLAKDLEQFWNMKRYDVLYDLFEPSFKNNYTKTAFVFLAQEEDDRLKLLSISVTNVTKDAIYLDVDRARFITKTKVNIRREGGTLYLEPLYFFKEFDPISVCQRVGKDISYEACGIDYDQNKTMCEQKAYFGCIFDYAQKNKEVGFCDGTGFLKFDCFKLFGHTISRDERIESCKTYLKESDMAACLTAFAEQTKETEYCKAIPFEQLQFRCIGHVSAMAQDISLCDVEARADLFNEIKLMACYTGYAQITKDDSFCRRIDPGKHSELGALAEECARYRTG